MTSPLAQKLQDRKPGQAVTRAVEAGRISEADIMRAVGFDTRNVAHQAALLIAERYGLDPLLKHVVVIPGKGAYVTRDGYLHVAHVSGQLDGMDLLDESEDDTHWRARVAVYRKDMSRPFSYPGRYPRKGSNKEYGQEMAIKTAERNALQRAFPVTGAGFVDDTGTASEFVVTGEGREVEHRPEPVDVEPVTGEPAEPTDEPPAEV